MYWMLNHSKGKYLLFP